MMAPSSAAPSSLIQDNLKKIAAYKTVEFVRSGMVVGLGTGSTPRHAVDRIAELLDQGELPDVIGIPTSSTTHEQALALGIPLSDLDSHPIVDLAIDVGPFRDGQWELFNGLFSG
ncbi:hypothetical protein MLD38_031450 [Melastoma candidum]|uniref:Uncharacterized protein n=1 Tax=Melastoma candidum TaxID=119954 RepID=A0ACB9MPI9_9MYRT|nr:hypothetical protein MLD38_031450 [Melastoma candidum]